MRFIILSLLFLLLSCASQNRRNAEVYMKAKKYELAYPLWKLELQESPGDADVIVAIDICQKEILNKKLITLRSLIKSKKLGEALSVSWEIKKNVNDWGLKHDHDSSSFESRLNDQLFKMFMSKGYYYLKNKQNLAALNLLRSHAKLFNSKKQKLKLIKRRKRINVAIKRKCKKFKNTRNSKPYYKLFTERYCSVVRQKGRSIASTTKSHVESLYSDLDIELRIKNLPHEVADAFTAKIKSAFRDSPWYHPDSKKVARGLLSGTYIQKYNSAPSTKKHSYTVDVPYTAYMSVQKSKQVPYQKSVYKCKSVQAVNQYGYADYSSLPTQVCGNVTETAYRTEYYYVKEPYTAYRSVAKTYTYPVLYEAQYLSLRITGSFIIGGLSKSINYTENISQRDYVSDTNLPDIELYPHPSKIVDPLKWIKSHLLPIQNKTEVSYKALYKKKYCEVGAGIGETSYINNIIACARLGAHSTAEVDHWFKNETGLEFDEANTYLGIY